MQMSLASWEDTETNRRVDLTVTYVAAGDAIEVKQITPTRVTFLCPDSQKPLSSIRIHREKARSILVRQLHERGYFKRLKRELLVASETVESPLGS